MCDAFDRPGETALSLEELVSRFRVGDRGAFMAFFDRTADLVLRFAHFAVDGRKARDRLVIAVYLEAWTHAPNFDPTHDSALVWLLDACYRQADTARLRRLRRTSTWSRRPPRLQ